MGCSESLFYSVCIGVVRFSHKGRPTGTISNYTHLDDARHPNSSDASYGEMTDCCVIVCTGGNNHIRLRQTGNKVAASMLLVYICVCCCHSMQAVSSL